MRIAFVNHSRRKVGGAEVYLDSVMPAFARCGHEVAWLYESDPQSDRELISLPANVATWCASSLGHMQTLEALRRWRPDVVFTHGLADPYFESAVIEVAPSVQYLHNYYGTCISGDKLHSIGKPRVCERQFGPACLLQYFPMHCGGRNPFTMWARYELQSRRLELMRRYRALVTNSEHMVREMARHHLHSECIYPFTSQLAPAKASALSLDADPLRLVFAGRMSALKGGQYLVGALPLVQKKLARNLHVTFAGDGPERHTWQKRADRLRTAQLDFSFRGWLKSSDLQTLLSQAHLLVFPSIWPEPFGLSGLEAGLFGVPAVAFAVGGVTEWLKGSVNGHLAPVPPSNEGLASAIVQVLVNDCHYEKLRAGAFEQAQRYRLDDHVAQLTRVFERCLSRSAA